MGNILVDLDATFGKIQFNYYSAKNRLDYVEASDLLFEANASLPKDARVPNMPMFEPKGNSLKHELADVTDAREYCRKWAPQIWAKLAQYREDMLQRLNDE